MENIFHSVLGFKILSTFSILPSFSVLRDNKQTPRLSLRLYFNVNEYQRIICILWKLVGFLSNFFSKFFVYLLPRLSFTRLHYLLALSLYYKKRLINNRIVSFSFELFMLAFFFIYWDYTNEIAMLRPSLSPSVSYYTNNFSLGWKKQRSLYKIIRVNRYF